MQKKNVLKGLLTVTAAAAMFGAFGVQAQTAGSSSTGSSTQSGSMGKDQSTGGSMGKDQSTGSSSGAAGMSGSTGTSGSSMQGGTGAAGAAAAGSTAAGGSLSKADQKILMSLAQANMAEIEAGKLAQSKSQNDQVKSFAQQMIDDHTKALNDVQALAQQKGVTLPTEPDAKHKAMASKLEKMSGDAFDKAYMAQAGVSDHKAVHSALLKDEKKAKDPDLKALVTKMTPVVEQHLKSAEQMPSPKAGTTSGK
jgi:predicted outer membrane protein